MSTSKGNLRPVRVLRQAFAWLLAAAFCGGVYRVYRWAEPSPASIAAILSPSPVSNVSLELEDAAFENFADGKKNWSLWAKRIALERQPGGVANSLQTATIDGIRDGKLFASPIGRGQGSGVRGQEQTQGTEGNAERGMMNDEYNAESHSSLITHHSSLSAPLNQSGSDSDPGPPSATFTAQHGRYLVGSSEGLPAEMQFTYAVQWQFQLTGDVKIQTREGHRFHAPAITILELYNRKTTKTERHILCSQGGDIQAKGATVHANQARYDDKNQTVECLGGVRAQLKQDSIQGEHFYWSMKNNVLRSPDGVSGVWQGSEYTAADIVMDVDRQVYQGRKLVMQINGKVASQLAAGSVGLVMSTGVVSSGQTAPTQKPASATAKTTAVADERGTFEADDFKHISKTNIFTGHNFTYIKGSRKITGDNGRYDRDKGILDADGHLVMDDPEHHGTCQKAHVEEAKALAVLTGDVVLTLKPQTAGGANAADSASSVSDAKKQGAVVTCDQVDSYYKKKFTVLRGHLVFKQHILREKEEPLDRTGTAEHAEYDGKAEVLTLFPPAQGHDSDESEFYSDKNNLVIVTKAGEETLSGAHGKVIARVKEDADDEGAAPVNPAKKPAPAPAPASPTKPDDAKKSEDPKKDTGKPGSNK